MELAKFFLDIVRVIIWPALVMTLALVFKRQLTELLERIQHADLPGGVGIDLDREIREAKVLSAKIQEQPVTAEKQQGRPAIPLTEANARMIDLDLRPSPSGLDMSYYRDLAGQDPNVALAGLRIEIDILARNLAKGFNVHVNGREFGSRLMRRLYEDGCISREQMQLATKVLQVCNAAVHGTPITREDADEVIGVAEVLSDQYLSWLSWGFGDGWTPRSERGTC